MRLQRVELPNVIWDNHVINRTWTPCLRPDAEAWAKEHVKTYRLETFQRFLPDGHPQGGLIVEVCHLIARSPKAAQAFQEKWGGELKPKPDLMSAR